MPIERIWLQVHDARLRQIRAEARAEAIDEKALIERLKEKIKVTSLEIIVAGTKDKPYFEIKYKEVGKEDYNIGYSSYDLNNVFGWKDECFEIVNQLAEESNGIPIIHGKAELELHDAEVRAKAIDEFAEMVELEILTMLTSETEYRIAKSSLDEIAEQLKEGGK